MLPERRVITEVGGLDRLMDGQDRPLGVDERLRAIADVQWGSVARWQARHVGLSATQIDGRLARGVLTPRHRGVYTFGHEVLRREGNLAAALLGAGPGSCLSAATAARWLALMRGGGEIHVATPHRTRVRLVGVRLHRPRSLPDDDIVVVDGLRCTTFARTMADLASLGRRQLLVNGLRMAEDAQVFDLGPLLEQLERGRGRPGIALLRAVLDEHVAGQGISESSLEDLWDERARCLPPHDKQARFTLPTRTVRFDALFQARGIGIELDSRKHHMSTQSFNDDKLRDLEVEAALGIRTFRLTFRHLTSQWPRTLAALRTVLAST